MDTLCQNCHDRCKIRCKVENGRLVKTTLFQCEKGAYLHELFHNPHRLLYPLKRKREKGGAQWMRISCDEAFDLMGNRFSEIRDHYGPEADNDIYQESDAVQLISATGVYKPSPVGRTV